MLTAERQIADGHRDFEDWRKETAEKTIAYDPKTWYWRCPICKQQTIHVSRGSDGTVAHFRHQNAASHPSISESQLHSEAKKEIKKKIEKENKIDKSELEKLIGTYPDSYQVADIYIETDEGEKIAVEIQCSLQKVADFKQRTRFYNDRDIGVIWLLYKENYAPRKPYNNHPSDDTLAFKEPVKWIQRNYYGRTYLFEDDFEVQPYRLKGKVVYRNSHSKHYPEYEETLQTYADYTTGDLDNYGIFTTNSNEYKIARFYDKCWWN